MSIGCSRGYILVMRVNSEGFHSIDAVYGTHCVSAETIRALGSLVSKIWSKAQHEGDRSLMKCLWDKTDNLIICEIIQNFSS